MNMTDTEAAEYCANRLASSARHKIPAMRRLAEDLVPLNTAAQALEFFHGVDDAGYRAVMGLCMHFRDGNMPTISGGNVPIYDQPAADSAWDDVRKHIARMIRGDGDAQILSPEDSSRMFKKAMQGVRSKPTTDQTTHDYT